MIMNNNFKNFDGDRIDKTISYRIISVTKKKVLDFHLYLFCSGRIEE
jgi:hypothetical protein